MLSIYMKKFSILAILAFLCVPNAVQAYDISIATATNGTLTSSHSTANSGQIVTLMATPESGFEPYCTVVGTQSVAVKEPTGVILNGEGTTLDGWVREREGSTQWAILDGNSFATSYDIISMSQTCTLTDLGFSETQLDASPSFTASVDMWVYSQGAKVARAVVAMLDASGNELEKVTVADDCEGHDWQTYTKTFTLVSGTRQLKYTLTGQDNVYWSGYYGPRFRNIDIQTDVRPANQGASTHRLRFVMPAENVTVQAYFEPSDPDVAVDDDPLVWTSYRRHFNGSGTADDPYTIENAAQLAQLAYDVNKGINYQDKIFVLTSDIDLSKTVGGERVKWVPIGGRDGVFQGKFYGRKYWDANAGAKCYGVKNMYINAITEPEDRKNYWYYYGLFGQASNTLRDVIVTDADIRVEGTFDIATPNVGILCGKHTSNGTFQSPVIYNCSVSGTLDVDTKSMGQVGGLVGWFGHYLSATIQACTSDVVIDVAGTVPKVGGIVGYFERGGSIVDCQARADITSNTKSPKTSVGGICGCYSDNGDDDFELQMTACVSTGSIKATGQGFVGGICGFGDRSRLDIHSCVSMSALSGEVSGILILGGICGYIQYGRLNHCAFAGYIDATKASEAGGIVGRLDYNSTSEEVVGYCLMAGTMATATDGDRLHAIVGRVVNDPLVDVAFCYYDKTLCGADALPETAQPHPTVKGLTTAELTTGKQQDLPFLLSKEDYGFVLAQGYYPRVFNNETSMTTSSGQYQRGAWLASLPVTMQTGDFAFDFVSTVTSKQQMGMWKEYTFSPATQQWEEKEVRLTNSVSIPRDATCIKVEGLTATAVQQGNFDITLGLSTLTRPFHFDIVSLGTIWDGTLATGFRTGDGSATTPYIIRTPQELAYAVNNSEEGKYYRQICDLWLNPRAIDPDDQEFLYLTLIEPRKGFHQWFGNTSWRGNYDGTGHYIRSLYTMIPQDIHDEAYGLFGTITASGQVKNLGVIDVVLQSLGWEWGTMGAYQNCHNGIGLLAGVCDGYVSNCLAQGVINTYRRYSKAYVDYFKMDYIGGLCGRVGATNSNALVEDCVSAVMMHGGYTVAGAFTSRLQNVNRGRVRHCLALSTQLYYGAYVDANGVEHNKEENDWGDSDCLDDCHYPKGYCYTGPSSEHPIDGDDFETLRNAFASSSLWDTDNEYFPMLSSFNKTYGKYLTLPFHAEEGESLPDFHKQITFNPGNLQWWAMNNGTIGYLEIDGDLGVIAPIKPSTLYDDYDKTWMPGIYGVSPEVNGQREIIVMQLGSSRTDVQLGISFVDDHVKTICLNNFDSNGDGHVSLSELGRATDEQTIAAFGGSSSNLASKIKQFPEFRYFKNVTSLTTQLQGLTSLESISLPYALETVGSDAFSGCSSLKEITIPAKVSTVNEHPFYGSAVENVYVDKFNEHFQSREGLLFDMDDRLIAYPNGRTGSATLSGDISEIAAGAIYKLTDCDSIFIDAPNYWDVIYLREGGIEGKSGALPDIYVNDATYDQTLLDAYLSDDSWWDYIEADRIHRYYPLSVTSVKAATMYIGFDTQLPDGLKPYIVKTTSEDDCIAYLTQLTDSHDKKTTQVPMLTPVVIFAEEAGQYKLFPLDEELEPFPMWKNLLIGSDRDGLPVYQEDAARGNILTLGRNSQGTLGFFYYKGKQIPPYRAYLAVNDIKGANAFSLNIDNDDTTTTIHETESANHPLENVVYNLNGQRISHHQLGKGVYIINGKKILIR